MAVFSSLPVDRPRPPRHDSPAGTPHRNPYNSRKHKSDITSVTSKKLKSEINPRAKRKTLAASSRRPVISDTEMDHPSSVEEEVDDNFDDQLDIIDPSDTVSGHTQSATDNLCAIIHSSRSLPSSPCHASPSVDEFPPIVPSQSDLAAELDLAEHRHHAGSGVSFSSVITS